MYDNHVVTLFVFMLCEVTMNHCNVVVTAGSLDMQ